MVDRRKSDRTSMSPIKVLKRADPNDPGFD